MTQTDCLEDILRNLMRDVVREELSSFAKQATPLRNATDDVYLSVTKAARVADVAPGTIRAWIRQGRLASKRAGRVLRIGRSELERFMAGELSAVTRSDITRRADAMSGKKRPAVLRRMAA